MYVSTVTYLKPSEDALAEELTVYSSGVATKGCSREFSPRAKIALQRPSPALEPSGKCATARGRRRQRLVLLVTHVAIVASQPGSSQPLAPSGELAQTQTRKWRAVFSLVSLVRDFQ